jgi:hypothetical protein
MMRRLAPYLVEGANESTTFIEGTRRIEDYFSSPRRYGDDPTVRKLRSQLMSKLAPLNGQLTDVLEALVADAGVDQLARARAKGLVHIESVDPGDALDLIAACVISARLHELGRPSHSSHMDRVIETFVDRLNKHLCSGQEYLIFDDKIASLTDSAIREGIFTPAPGPAGRSAQAMTASELMARLPTFPRATVDEVIDIRTELASPLTRFRGAMVTVSQQFASESWEPGFADEVHDAWVEHVAPAIDEIEQTTAENRSLLALAADMAGAVGSSTPGLVVLAAGVASHGDVLAGVGGGATLVAPFLQALRNRSSADHAIRMRPFYFLYGVNEALLR